MRTQGPPTPPAAEVKEVSSLPADIVPQHGENGNRDGHPTGPTAERRQAAAPPKWSPGQPTLSALRAFFEGGWARKAGARATLLFVALAYHLGSDGWAFWVTRVWRP